LFLSVPLLQYLGTSIPLFLYSIVSLKPYFPTSGCSLIGLRKSTDSDVIFKASSPIPCLLHLFFYLLLYFCCCCCCCCWSCLATRLLILHRTKPSVVQLFCNFGHPIASFAIKQLFFRFILAMMFLSFSSAFQRKK
jgi:hypothetical protein